MTPAQQQSLITINNILNGFDVPYNHLAIEGYQADQFCREYVIEGGESFDELLECAKCYVGEIGAKIAETLHYMDTVAF